MIVFPSMLLPAAKQANMLVPENPDEFDRDEFPHFACFCVLQLGRAMRMGEHWDNAQIIAGIPEQELRTMTLEQFLAKGLHYTAN